MPPHGFEVLYCELNGTIPLPCKVTEKPLCPKKSFVEYLPTKENGPRSSRNSETSYLILDNDTISVDPLATRTEMSKENNIFVMPVLERVSSFRPNDFGSKLLPLENKPLETAMLKRVKDLLTNNDVHVIALHILRMDCKVRCFWFFLENANSLKSLTF